MQNWFHISRMKINSGNLGKGFESTWNMRQWIGHTWSQGLKPKLPIKQEPCIWKWKHSCGNGTGRVTLLEWLMNLLSTQNKEFLPCYWLARKYFSIWGPLIEMHLAGLIVNKEGTVDMSGREISVLMIWKHFVYYYQSSFSGVGHTKHLFMCMRMCIFIFLFSSTPCIFWILKVTGNCCQICSVHAHMDKMITTVAIFKKMQDTSAVWTPVHLGLKLQMGDYFKVLWNDMSTKRYRPASSCHQ